MQFDPGEIRSSQRTPFDSDQAVLPLINVVLLLLVFFMVAGSLRQLSAFEVRPPTVDTLNQTALGAAHASRLLRVEFSKTGQIGVDGRGLSLAELAQHVESQASRRPAGLRLIVAADSRASAVDLLELIERLQSLEVEQLELLVLADKPGSR